MSDTVTVNMGEAKTRLSQLVDMAERGSDVVIARNGTPAVRLTPIEVRRPNFGFAPRDFSSNTDYLEPMSEEELSLWYDGPVFPED